MRKSFAIIPMFLCLLLWSSNSFGQPEVSIDRANSNKVSTYGNPADLEFDSGNNLASLTNEFLDQSKADQIAKLAEAQGFKAARFDFSTGEVTVAADASYAPSPALLTDLENWVKENFILSENR